MTKSLLNICFCILMVFALMLQQELTAQDETDRMELAMEHIQTAENELNAELRVVEN